MCQKIHTFGPKCWIGLMTLSKLWKVLQGDYLSFALCLSIIRRSASQLCSWWTSCLQRYWVSVCIPTFSSRLCHSVRIRVRPILVTWLLWYTYVLHPKLDDSRRCEQWLVCRISTAHHSWSNDMRYISHITTVEAYLCMGIDEILRIWDQRDEEMALEHQLRDVLFQV